VISVVVPVSPIPSHPSTAILEETVASIRHHLPDSELFLTFDGVRAEQEDRTKAYEEHIRQILWKAKQWGRVVPWVFDRHCHQTGMLRFTLNDIRDPLLLYVEQDTPLVTDEPINWDEISGWIKMGMSDLVRLYHEATPPEEHKHLLGAWVTGFQETWQWSQRPHVASVAYYRRIMDSHFTPEAKSFIEDRMYGVVEEAHKLDGDLGWQQHRIHIYAPESDGNWKRSYHLDGRAGSEKFDYSQVY
jgi:hypothetical protein